MTLKNIDILEINQFLKTIFDKKLPQKISYAIIKNTTVYEEETSYYQKALEGILARYSDYIVMDENGQAIYEPNGLPRIDEEHSNDFLQEVNDLLGVDVEVKTYTIPKETFDYDDAKYDVLSPKETLNLMKILTEPDTPTTVESEVIDDIGMDEFDIDEEI